MGRRPELLSSVMLRQNPHNVHEWHKRVKLFEGNPTRQILTFTEVGERKGGVHMVIWVTHACICAMCGAVSVCMDSAVIPGLPCPAALPWLPPLPHTTGRQDGGH